jgi:hypothetical protein
MRRAPSAKAAPTVRWRPPRFASRVGNLGSVIKDTAEATYRKALLVGSEEAGEKAKRTTQSREKIGATQRGRRRASLADEVSFSLRFSPLQLYSCACP